ncbi:hypothetical protein Pelo_5435 [Pelomyxa schiedti]|nr:hypothetical protein Pelo_5435 [Pelomyxa schiedti]
MAQRKEEGYIHNLCANWSWLVNLKNDGKLLVVTRVASFNVDPHGVSIALPDLYSRAIFLVLNKVIPSQAVILVEHKDQESSSILVIDVASTYSLEGWVVQRMIAMQNKVGENVFIISASSDDNTVVLSTQSNGQIRKLYTYSTHKSGLYLAQVSGSLFSVHNNKRLDIWDCNDTTNNYPLVKSIPRPVDDTTFQVGGGFIVLIENRRDRLRVIDASSTDLIVSLGISGWSITKMWPCISFLW